MGEIKTCRKYENPIKFTATHKLFLDANHKPIIRGAEKAVWNRLKPVPFTVTISTKEMDKGLLGKLKCEAEGILAWMIDGCRLWMEQGLGDPPEIAEASAAWQAESDRFPAFLEEVCVMAPDAWAPVARLWPAYHHWCDSNNERSRLSKTEFDEKLAELGCRKGSRENASLFGLTERGRSCPPVHSPPQKNLSLNPQTDLTSGRMPGGQECPRSVPAT